MANLADVLKDEVRRLARKELKVQLPPLQTAIALHRRELAALKRSNIELTRKLALLERTMARPSGTTGPAGAGARKKSVAAAEAGGREVRFSPQWVVNHRKKLGLSQADYARLVGVSAVTIYHWEAGNSRPKPSILARWGAVKHLGKREATRRLAELE